MFRWLRDRRRRRLLSDPFPVRWERVLQENVGHFPRLSDAQRARLRDATRVLVAEKTWEGCGGVFVTEEMKVTIAAQAALLLLGGADDDYYARVPSVIVYPTAFATPNPDDGWEDDALGETALAGQAVYRGPVILSWDEVLAEGRNPAGGVNVVVHEFAHQLDFLDYGINGTPPLDDPALAAKWAPVMTAAFKSHTAAVDRGDDTFFTAHAADDEGEFFADASEAFFCDPYGLREVEPGVFDLLAGYYMLDPRAWFPEDAG